MGPFDNLFAKVPIMFNGSVNLLLTFGHGVFGNLVLAYQPNDLLRIAMDSYKNIGLRKACRRMLEGVDYRILTDKYSQNLRRTCMTYSIDLNSNDQTGLK